MTTLLVLALIEALFCLLVMAVTGEQFIKSERTRDIMLSALVFGMALAILVLIVGGFLVQNVGR